jgi:hypothetical protein
LWVSFISSVQVRLHVRTRAGSAEAVASSYVEVDDPGLFGDRLRGCAQWRALAQRPVGTVLVVVDLELAQRT